MEGKTATNMPKSPWILEGRVRQALRMNEIAEAARKLHDYVVSVLLWCSSITE
jgi:hypothetical protein